MRFPSSLLVASLLVAGSLTAQTKPCFSANDATNAASNAITAWSSVGPAYWALKWTPTSTHVAQGLSIFTGNNFLEGYHTLEIWSHDSTANAPKARLTGGTMAIPKGTVHSWNGTNFDKIQVMTAKTTYWIVWGEPGWSYLPSQVGGNPILPLARRVGTTGGWTSSTGWGFKFRLFCSRRDGARAKAFGSPCNGAAGMLATAFTNTDPKVGNSAFRVEGTGVPSGAVSLLILGGNKNWKGIPLNAVSKGCWLNTDIIFVFGGMSGTGNQRAKFTVGAANHVLFPLPIPSDKNLIGAFLGTQVAVHDPKSSNPLPMVFTNAVQLTLY